MICLRCGYCCKNLAVIIINDPDIGLKEGNTEFHNGRGNPCKHLVGTKPGEYSCALHNKPWYVETPCFNHTQFETSNCNCRMGAYIMEGKKR